LENNTKPTKQRSVAGYVIEQLLHRDDFESDLASWSVEQQEGGTTKIREGVLDVLKRVFASFFTSSSAVGH